MADRAKTWTGPEADAIAACALVNKLAGYPRKGVGGSLVQVDEWDGAGDCPAGWTMAVAPVVDPDTRQASIAVKARDADRLTLPDERAKLTPEEQAAADKIAWSAKAAAVEAEAVRK
ncbi:MAG: hypothetical protein WC211_00910 [Dehalococcoidia bacterium]